ncbi:MAG: tetratricopeptide repeat protein [Gemmatimonadota bacterium]|nr:tetratricopeptide repeat protein [Gemmatimonadota bacterium]
MALDGPGLEALRERSEALAEDLRWAELVELLSPVADDLLEWAAIAYRLGEALYHTGRMEELRLFAQKLEAGMRRSRDAAGLLRALNLAGIAAFELGRMDEARQAFASLLELAEGEGDDDMLARAANNLGALANLQGRREEALSFYQLALPLYQRLGRSRGLAQTHQNLGISFRDMGLLRESDAEFGQAAELGRGFGYEPIIAMATVGRAEVAVLRGDPNLGLEIAERGLALARRIDDPITQGVALRVRAAARIASEPENGGRERALAAAGDDLRAALEIAGRTGNALLEAEALRDLARLEALRSREGAAAEQLMRAAERFAALGAEEEARRLREESAAALT